MTCSTWWKLNPPESPTLNQGVSEMILSKLDVDRLDITKSREQANDNAAIIVGRQTSVQQRVNVAVLMPNLFLAQTTH
ncbi:hypothetical protein NPIL_380061 [Nephila pilipes]|uniref:Uncharacterized protein n=1 Tax=Nephila pilipes TaxID=299642 RepID=A0A8X6THC6_NEPPI|nr:hypothetical protein NPIL_380061 [Nephila pilipes]